MSLEYIDDVHELVVENKRLKDENGSLKWDMRCILRKLEDFQPILEHCIGVLEKVTK